MQDGQNAQRAMHKNAQSDPELKVLPSRSSSGVWQSGTSKLALTGFPSSPRFASLWSAGLHKFWYPGIRDTSTWSKFGAHGEHGDVFLFSNLGAL